MPDETQNPTAEDTGEPTEDVGEAVVDVVVHQGSHSFSFDETVGGQIDEYDKASLDALGVDIDFVERYLGEEGYNRADVGLEGSEGIL